MTFRTTLIAAVTAILCAGSVAPNDILAQSASAAQQLIATELSSRNLSMEEARAALRSAGINVDSLQPADALAMRSTILSILDRASATKRLAGASSGIARQADTGAVRQGITVDTGMRTRSIPEPRTSPEDSALRNATGDVIYGHALLRNPQLEVYRTTDGARAPDTYRLGRGDQVRVTIFGGSQADLLLEVNSEGYVQPAQGPQVYVQGLSLTQARALLRARLRGFYSFNDDEIGITVSSTRTVSVSVFGEVVRPGTYNLSALNSMFNVLVAAGGVTDAGTLRRIEVVRGAERFPMDLYEYLSNPSGWTAQGIQEGDIIIVPLREKAVQIVGAVRRPGKYELLATENLADLLRLAGGAAFDADSTYLQIETIRGDSVVIREASLSEATNTGSAESLRDGDVARVRAIGNALANFVEVTGAVVYPGRIDLDRARSLRQALDRAEVRSQAVSDLFIIERLQSDGSVRTIPVRTAEGAQSLDRIPLQARDRVLVLSREAFASNAAITVAGAVRQPFERLIPIGTELQLRDVLSLAGGLLPSAAPDAYLVRRPASNPTQEIYLRLDLVTDSLAVVQAGDRLQVYDRRDVALNGGVSISGAVRNPQRLNYDRTLTLRNVIELAGGLTSAAALARIDVFRMRIVADSGSQFQQITIRIDSTYRAIDGDAPFTLAPYDQIVVREIPMFDATRSVQISGQVMYPGVYALSGQTYRLSDALRSAGGLTPTADSRNAFIQRTSGRVGTLGVDLSKALRGTERDVSDPVLLPGDLVQIPEVQQTVSLNLRATNEGERRALLPAGERLPDQLSFIYRGPRSAKWYVNQFAGGFGKKADRSSVTVTEANGQVRGTTRRLGLIRVYPAVTPGSTVSLLYKPEPVEAERNSVNWDLLYTRTLQTLSTLLTLIVVSKQL